MITKEIQGSILDTELKYIAHGVNAQDVMGSGVAKVLYTKYPDVKSKYHQFCAETDIEDRLGSIVYTPVQSDGKVIINLFTQFKYGYDGKRYVNYGALEDCFCELIDFGIDKIAVPKIGCGLAGGDWEVVKEIINRVTKDKLEVWVYYI